VRDAKRTQSTNGTSCNVVTAVIAVTRVVAAAEALSPRHYMSPLLFLAIRTRDKGFRPQFVTGDTGDTMFRLDCDRLPNRRRPTVATVAIVEVGA
jgi:hypothetical protein